jgi:hypothetical protein
VEDERLRLHLSEPNARPGSEVQGRAEFEGSASLRLRGEVTTYRPETSDESEQDAPRWLAETTVLLWQELRLTPNEREFRFELPKGCPPSAQGQRFRVAYSLDLYTLPAGAIERLELQVSSSKAPSGQERSAALGPASDEVEPPGRSGPPDAEVLLDAVEPRGWLDKILQGRNRMDRILERAIRGKLVEPEDLLAMQATMYGYSKALSHIPPGPEASKAEEDAAVSDPPSFVLAQDVARPGGRIEIRLELAQGATFEEAVAELMQSERSSCHGIESRIEQTVSLARCAGPAELTFSLLVPGAVAPSVRGPNVEMGYWVRVTVRDGGKVLQGQVGIGMNAAPDQGFEPRSASGPDREGRRRPAADLRSPAGGG